jgi:hypothetical protein
MVPRRVVRVSFSYIVLQVFFSFLVTVPFIANEPLTALALCGFRGKAGTIPKSSRSPFRNEAGHDSGMKPVTDSDFKPVTFRRWSEP